MAQEYRKFESKDDLDTNTMCFYHMIYKLLSKKDNQIGKFALSYMKVESVSEAIDNMTDTFA